MTAALCLAAPLPVHAADHQVTIEAMKFGAVPKQLKIGDTITWRNTDILRHTATARNGAFDVTLAPGAKAAITLQKAGAITVFCRYHPDMTLILLVTK